MYDNIKRMTFSLTLFVLFSFAFLFFINHFEPTKFLFNYCATDANLFCTNLEVNTKSITFKIKNNDMNTITLKQLEIKDLNCSLVEINKTIEFGDSLSINIPCIQEKSTEKKKHNLTIIYHSGTPPLKKTANIEIYSDIKDLE
ncbi:MAG TPA: hypothetical protein PLX15_04615 [Candidatus Woesearchaeota archaeon]|nr:hypothetical protein [Candidatus Woesearchaeota archaeon]